MENKKLGSLESNIIDRVLEGNHPVFKILRSQKDKLYVCDRIISPRGISFQFESDDPEIDLVTGSEANMKILDTRIFVKEQDAFISVKLTILKGKMFALTLGGIEEPDKASELTPVEAFWCSSFKRDLSSVDVYRSSSDRDFNKAFGYIPGYK